MADQSEYLLETEPLQGAASAVPARLGHVLVVDDDQDVLTTLQAVLSGEGHDVVGVSSGQAALQVLHQQAFDVLLVDMRLEDVDGLTVLANAMREQPELIGIVLTGYGSLDTAIEALDAGAFSYLLKPCNVEQLKAAVLRGLEKRATAEALRELQRVGEVAARDRADAALREARAREEAARRAAERAAERVAHLQAVTAQLARYMEPQALLEQVVRAATQLLETPIAAVYVLPHPNADFEMAAAEGLDAAQAATLPRQHSLGARALDQRRTLAVDDVRHTPNIALPALASGRKVGSIIVAPIYDGPTPLGVIEVYTPTPRAWTQDEIDLLSSLAAASGVALVSARTHEDLQRATRTRDEVMATVTHDLKTPLTTISGVAQLLKRQAGQPPTPERTERLANGLDTIHKMAATMASLIDELMDTVRLQYGEPVHLDIRRVDLARLAEDVVHDHKPNAPAHELRLERPDSLLLDGDGQRLRRVLDNLVSNAIKYSPDGGTVNVRLAADGAEAVVAVQDCGIGINPEDVPVLFEPFRRGGNTAGIAGSGVGLLSVKRIIELHGGSVDVQSTKGEGTTVTVRLPLKRRR